MVQQAMYPAVVNSKLTELAGAIDDVQTTITVVDASVLPAAPNLAVIGNGENAETILYTGVAANDLTGVTRGFQGTAAVWAAGVKVARYFTAYDHDAFKANVEDHESRIVDTEAQLAQNQKQTATISRGLQIIATDQDTPMWIRILLGKHVVNHVPLFDSGLWSLHANVTVDSPSKITLNATANQEFSSISGIHVTEGQTYTLSAKFSGGSVYFYYKDATDTIIGSLSGHVVPSSESSISVVAPAGAVTAEIVCNNVSSGAGTFTFENIMFNEGATAEAFVANLKPLEGLYLKRFGENLLPTFAQATVLHANANIINLYELELVATASGEHTYWMIPIVPNEAYTFSGTVSGGTGGYYQVEWFDSDETFIAVVGLVRNTTGSVSGVAPANAAYARVYATSDAVGTYTYTVPMLNLGSTALPFVPQNNDTLYITHPLYGDPVTGVRDLVEQVDGSLIATKPWKSLVLDSSLDWVFDTDYTGYKLVRAELLDTPVDNSGIVSKYDGSILQKYNGAYDSADIAYAYNATPRIYITIADTDSGFPEDLTPTTADWKCFFNGWKYQVATDDWISIGDSSTVVDYTTAQNTVAPDYTPYQLIYQRAEPETIELVEGVDWHGSLSFHEGDNLVELGEAAVYKEEVTPYVHPTFGFVYIDAADSSAYLNYRNEKILKVYKNEEEDINWVIDSAGDNGKQRAYIAEADYDPTANYFVTYIAESYQLSAHADSVEAEYATNLRTVVARNVQDIADVKQDVSDLAWGKADKAQEQWITLIKFNGWVNVDAATEYAEYMQDEFGFMHFRGSLGSGTKTTGTLVAMIPAELAPEKMIRFPILNADGTTVNVSVGQGVLLNTGEIEIYTDLAYNANIQLLIPLYIPGR